MILRLGDCFGSQDFGLSFSGQGSKVWGYWYRVSLAAGLPLVTPEPYFVTGHNVIMRGNPR